MAQRFEEWRKRESRARPLDPISKKSNQIEGATGSEATSKVQHWIHVYQCKEVLNTLGTRRKGSSPLKFSAAANEELDQATSNSPACKTQVRTNLTQKSLEELKSIEMFNSRKCTPYERGQIGAVGSSNPQRRAQKPYCSAPP